MPVCAIAAPAQKIELTDAQALAVSDIMLNAGDLPAAESLLNDILQSGDVDIRTGALFQLGRVAAMRGEYSTAERYFLTILKFYPDMTPVRLELAQVYFLSEQYSLADFNFRLVLADKNLPPNMAERVRKLIAQSRQRKNWSLNAGLSIVPDSNINNATGRAQECINFGFGVMCRPLERENYGIGLRYSLGGDYYLRLTDHWGIKNSAYLSALDFATSRYDDYSLYLASGPRYLMSRGDVSLQPFAQMRWYAGKYYSTVPGLRLDATYDITRRVSLAGGVSYTHTKYHDGRINDIYRSN
ncbi:MAG: surface lipoprotein assembly modifier [Alphaproteobacteria bacterium]|nr:surface lipoprotein assembly modifier [Alphaproteobacteria bacterium]